MMISNDPHDEGYAELIDWLRNAPSTEWCAAMLEKAANARQSEECGPWPRRRVKMTNELFSQIIGTGIGLVVAFFIIRALARRFG